MKLAWVIGAGGLLGTALTRHLQETGTRVFVPTERFNWHCEQTLFAQIGSAIRDFSALVHSADSWEIYWAAGVGAMGSESAELARETRALAALLSGIAAQQPLAGVRGAFGFSSSAGAIYAGSTADLITEDTEVAPTTPYAREKLAQEALLAEFAALPDAASVLVARLSTLYGPGQSSEKKQGLITHIARSVLRKRAVQIYVPFDTTRDYLIADDAATAIVGVLRLLDRGSGLTIKIVASEQPTTIAEIISVFRRVTRQPPRIVTSSSKLSALYLRCVRFRSRVLCDQTPKPRTVLLVGVAQVMEAERLNLVRPAAQTLPTRPT